MATAKTGKPAKVKYVAFSEQALLKSVGNSGATVEIKHFHETVKMDTANKKAIALCAKNDATKFAEFVKANKGVSNGDTCSIGLTPTAKGNRSIASLVSKAFQAKINTLADADGKLPSLLIGASQYSHIYVVYFWEAMGKLKLEKDFTEKLAVNPKGTEFQTARQQLNDASNIKPRAEKVKPPIFRQAVSAWFVALGQANVMMSKAELKQAISEIKTA